MRKEWGIGAVCGIAAVVATLIIKSESLPLDRVFYESSFLTAVFGLLNLPVLIVLVVTQIDYKPFALSLIFIQWFLIGSFAAWIFRRLRQRSLR